MLCGAAPPWVLEHDRLRQQDRALLLGRGMGRGDEARKMVIADPVWKKLTLFIGESVEVNVGELGVDYVEEVWSHLLGGKELLQASRVSARKIRSHCQHGQLD